MITLAVNKHLVEYFRRGFSYGPPSFKVPGNPFANLKPSGNPSPGMSIMRQYNMINNSYFVTLNRDYF